VLAALLYAGSTDIETAAIPKSDDGPFAGMGYPYSESTRAGGLLFLAGQTSKDADGKLVPGASAPKRSR